MTDQKRVEEVVKHLDAIIKLCLMTNSESNTERLAYDLYEASDKAITEIEKSHDNGLCMDARWILAEALLRSHIH